MVKILNGEIVQDNDPRLSATKRQPSNASFSQASTSSGPAPRPELANRSAFDFTTPPIQLTNVSPESFMGMPDVLVFGAPVKMLHLCALAAATVFAGWRAALAGGLLLYIYTASQTTPPPSRTAQPHSQAHYSSHSGSAQGVADTPSNEHVVTQPKAKQQFPGTGRKLVAE